MRLNAVFFLMLTAGLPALAADNELQRCRAIADSMARLACYDALAATPAAATVAPTPSTTAAATPSPTAQFGREAQAVRTLPDAVDSQIMGAFDGWGPRTMFRLANGQVWQVVDDSSAVYDLKDPKVRVRRAALGSFLMEIDGAKRTPRVRRID